MNGENLSSLVDDDVVKTDLVIIAVDLMLVRNNVSKKFRIRIEVAGKVINLTEDEAEEEGAVKNFNRIDQSFKTTAENGLKKVMAGMNPQKL